MEVIKLSGYDVDKYKASLKKLLKQSFDISFPETIHDIESFSSRVETLKKYLSNGEAIVFGSKDNNELKGFIWFFIKKTSMGEIIHINHFVISENERGAGIGTSLWEKMEDLASTKKIKEIELFVTKNNTNAVSFYLNKDFEVSRYVMKKRIL